MSNTKTTKRGLFTSVFAMLLCVAMFVGTTFAWFTDSVTSGNNNIQAGNLDIELEYSKDGSSWASVENKTDLFSTNLWEPGHTEVVYFHLSNEGTLALKYQLSMNINSETTATNVEGNTFKLSQYLKYAIVDGDTVYATREEALTAAATSADTLTNYVKNGQMDASAELYFAWIVYMPETVGNEANYRGRAPKIKLGVNVVATQVNSESDSFGPDYDTEAPYPVSNTAELLDAILNATPGSIIPLTSGSFSLSQTTPALPAGVTLVGSGKDNTKITAPATPSGTKKTGLVISNANTTISDLKITKNLLTSSDEYCGVVDIREGGTTLDNVEIISSSNAAAVVIKSGFGVGETITLSNSTLKGGYKTINIVDGANGTVVIDNCESTGIYPLNVNSASSQNLVIKVSNSKFHGWTSYGHIHSASFVNTEFSKGESDYDFMKPYADTTWENCTFDSEFLLGAGATGKTYVINNCTKDGVAITAENVQSLLLAMDDSDEAPNLRGCTIIVNGTTVTLS